jgi:hypothetical protein
MGGIGGNYTNPVYVNGYQCWNCTQVDQAKKGVDPADPKAGPYGIDANSLGQTPAALRPASTAPGLGGNLDVTV